MLPLDDRQCGFVPSLPLPADPNWPGSGAEADCFQVSKDLGHSPAFLSLWPSGRGRAFGRF